jgi:hypothetical protein
LSVRLIGFGSIDGCPLRLGGLLSHLGSFGDAAQGSLCPLL